MFFRELTKKVIPVAVISATLLPSANAQISSEATLNKLRMTNRAQCALDSDQATESVFMVIDGYNAGKLGHNLAKNIGADPALLSANAMQDFRISVSRLTSDIINKLFVGSLPLLPVNIKTSTLTKYNSLAEICAKKTHCPELNAYLAKIWDNSEGLGLAWEKIDSFSNKNFISAPKNNRVSCFYVKRFSPLQAHLHSPAPDKVILQEMAQAYKEKEKYVTSCENRDATIDSRNSILQLDLKVENPQDFANYGFDFWNSVKVYLSFAWRHARFVEQVNPAFSELFKSIALEESLMMIPNGCKSIEKPECDAETLSMNSLRELAKPDGAKKAEPGKELPLGPEQGVVGNGPRGVNDDFLGTRSYQDASEWVENFRKNYVQTRGSLKNRVQSATQILNILSASLSAPQLAEYVRPLAFAKSFSNAHRDELYYLCTETRLAGDQRIDFMKTGIDKIQQMTVMQKAFETSKKSLPELTQYFDTLAEKIISVCDQLEQKNIWNIPGYQVNRSGFSSWARELLNIPHPGTIANELQPIAFGPPLLTWSSDKGSTAGNVICMSGIDCTRKIIKSMVDLYAVAKYADAFLPVTSTVASPDIFNPYAELKACKVYDPWFATRRANRRLFADLASTALFGWNPIPLYIDLDFKAPRVTTLNQLIQNGTVKFDPKIERTKMEAALLADFGPLVGAPCAVSIAPNSAKNFNFYAFNGISVNYCSINSDGSAVGSPGGNVENSTPASRSYCGGCSINFVGVTSSAAVSSGSPLNPIKLGVYLFRAIYRFLDAKKDNVNIPKAYEIDIKKVVDIYKEWGRIPDFCEDQVIQGYGCYQNICTAKAADFFEKYTGKKITSIAMYESPDDINQHNYTKQVYIKSDLCPDELQMTIQCNDDGTQFKTVGKSGGLFARTRECRDAINRNQKGTL